MLIAAPITFVSSDFYKNMIPLFSLNLVESVKFRFEKFTSTIKMDAAPPPSGSKTNISDLDDECLREVFEYLDPDHLTAIADVCARFRQNAVATARSKVKKIELDKNSLKREFSKLRNFGASIEFVEVDGDCYWYANQVNYQKRVIELLTQYCVGEAVVLQFSNFDLNDGIVNRMRPLLVRVRQIELFNCQPGKLFLENLPFWAPELRILSYESCKGSNGEEMRFESLHRKFPKMEAMRFSCADNLKNSDIEEFLKKNPQLKGLGAYTCRRIDDGIFRSIVKHVPKIEEIWFMAKNLSSTNGAKNFRQLHELKSLTIGACGAQYLLSVLQEIVLGNNSLEYLKLVHFNFPYDYQSQQLIEVISKMQKLKELHFTDVKDMTSKRIINMCKPLKELSVVRLLGFDLKMTKDDLLAFIQNAEKLQEMWYHPLGSEQTMCSNFDVGTFAKLVKIVDKRQERTKLNLVLDRNLFTVNIPADLASAARNLKLENFENFENL